NVVSSGNQDIDNLIKATYTNQLNFRLEWIPFNDFTNIAQIGTGGFSEIYTATWTKGRIIGWNNTTKEYNRSKGETIVLKVLKDSQNISSEFLKELQNIVKSQPNSHKRYLIQYKIFIEAENKREELLKSGQFIAKYMHPCSKTHSKLLNPTIDLMLSLFQNSSGSTDTSQNIKMPDSKPNTLSITEAIYQITILSNLNLNHDKKCDEAGKALAEALDANPTVEYLDLSSKELCNGAGRGIAKALCTNSTL
ncbi:23756_t:CDS:2, partial [Racocetra persica]